MKLPAHPRFIAFSLAVGMNVAQATGVAALKDQPYHRDISAQPVVYSRIIDSHGPYLRLVSGNKNVDILRSKMVARVEVADGIPDSIMVEEDIAPLREILATLSEFSARYPRSARLLENQISTLTFHVNHFDAGDVRFEANWISKSGLVRTQQARRLASEAAERAEVEKRAFDGYQRDKGLVLHDGKWMTHWEIEHLPAEAPTELSDCIEPLWNGDLDGARFAVKNLTDLTTRQTGAPKIRTERLLTVTRNLFLAEASLTHRIIASNRDDYDASIHDKNAKDWLKPNGFGTVTYDASKESREKAAQIRQRSADELVSCKQELRDQLHEAEILADDFSKLREKRVTLILRAATRAVSSRHFTETAARTAPPPR